MNTLNDTHKGFTIKASPIDSKKYMESPIKIKSSRIIEKMAEAERKGHRENHL